MTSEKDVEALVTKVIEWCMNSMPQGFDDSFVHSLYIQHFEGKKLSPRQVQALENICAKFAID